MLPKGCSWSVSWNVWRNCSRWDESRSLLQGLGPGPLLVRVSNGWMGLDLGSCQCPVRPNMVRNKVISIYRSRNCLAGFDTMYHGTCLALDQVGRYFVCRASYHVPWYIPVDPMRFPIGALIYITRCNAYRKDAVLPAGNREKGVALGLTEMTCSCICFNSGVNGSRIRNYGCATI